MIYTKSFPRRWITKTFDNNDNLIITFDLFMGNHTIPTIKNTLLTDEKKIDFNI
jgi:hypothetical protein